MLQFACHTRRWQCTTHLGALLNVAHHVKSCHVLSWCHRWFFFTCEILVAKPRLQWNVANPPSHLLAFFVQSLNAPQRQIININKSFFFFLGWTVSNSNASSAVIIKLMFISIQRKDKSPTRWMRWKDCDGERERRGPETERWRDQKEDRSEMEDLF